MGGGRADGKEEVGVGGRRRSGGWEEVGWMEGGKSGWKEGGGRGGWEEEVGVDGRRRSGWVGGALAVRRQCGRDSVVETVWWRQCGGELCCVP